MSAEEAWAQARARAEWDAEVPKPLDPGDPPFTSAETMRAIAIVGPEWILEQSADSPPARWVDTYHRVMRAEPPLPEKVSRVERRVLSLEEKRVASLEERVSDLEDVIGPGTGRSK